MSRWGALLQVFLAAGAFAACTPKVALEEAESRVGGDVVAVVDGASISRRDVELRARARGISPREALTSLENDLLLGAAARRRGLQPGDLDTRRDQVLAQMVLRAVERENPESALDDDAVAARMPTVAASLRRAERRLVAHLLVRAETDDAATLSRAEAAARRAISLARAEPLGEATLERVESRLRAEQGAMDLVVERLGALERSAPVEAPFLRAVFEADGPGVLVRPIRTSFGVHVIHVVRIDPAYEPPTSEVRARATEAALEARRAEAVSSLLVAARDRFGVEVRESVVRRSLADDALFQEVR